MKSIKSFINESQFLIGKEGKDNNLTKYNSIYTITKESPLLMISSNIYKIDEFIKKFKPSGLPFTKSSGDIIEYSLFGINNKEILNQLNRSAEDIKDINNFKMYIAYNFSGTEILAIGDGKEFKVSKEILNGEDNDIVLIYLNIDKQASNVKKLNTIK